MTSQAIMRTSLRILALLTILSCSVKDKTVDTKITQGLQADSTPKDAKDTILLQNVVAHYFSSPIAKDTFRITLTGQTINNGTVEFDIQTYQGLVIHYRTFPSYDLIGYGLDNNASEPEKEEYIKSRISNFFEEENFRQPAISKNDKFEEDYSNKEIWDDIGSDTTAVTFEYLIGEESFGRIAYSKKLDKVVTIFSCC